MLYQIPGTSFFVDPSCVTVCYPNGVPGKERVLCIGTAPGGLRAINIPEPFTPARIASEIALRANDPAQFASAGPVKLSDTLSGPPKFG